MGIETAQEWDREWEETETNKYNKSNPAGNVRSAGYWDLLYNISMSNSSKHSDNELVIRIRSGEPELFSEIIDRYEKKLLRYAITIVHREDIATDIVQDAYIKAYTNLQGFDAKKSFSSWIYRIVHNEAINAIKKYKREVPLPMDMDVRSADDIESEYISAERVKQASWCLSHMPDMYSEPLSLFFIEELSYEEISDVLRIPMGTVATRINRAKAMMKVLCQKQHVS